ncbi:MAG: hypothetical protein K1X57_18420, partial [Gemmataceae bacterium]|nr:hypothetical protein [Gemmataceae bacterium]
MKSPSLRAVERLESRLVPAALIDRGDFYRAGGAAVPLAERAGQVAVQWSGPADWASLTSAGGMLAGLRVVQELGDDAAILEFAPGPRLDAREAAPVMGRAGVLTAAPVFANPATGGYVIALDEVVIRLKPGLDAESFFAGDSRFSSHRPLAGTPDQFYATVAAGNGRATLALAEDLSHDARLIWASPALAIESVRYTNDPNFANQWHLNNT